MNESCRIYEWVISHRWMSHVAQMIDWYCFYYFVRNSLVALLEALRASHLAHVNKSCRTYEGVLSHVWMSHIAHMNESSRTYEWVLSYTRMSHVTHTNESCRKSSRTCKCVILRIWAWVCHVAKGCRTKTKRRAGGGSMNESCLTYEWIMAHIGMCRVTHRNVSCHTCEWVMSRRAVVQGCRGRHRSHPATWPENQGSLYVHIHGCNVTDWWT